MIEIGRKYEIVNSSAGNNGKIVTVLEFLGKADGTFCESQGDRYRVDIKINTVRGVIIDHVGELQLKPIYDGDEKITWESMADIFTPNRILHGVS